DDSARRAALSDGFLSTVEALVSTLIDEKGGKWARLDDLDAAHGFADGTAELQFAVDREHLVAAEDYIAADGHPVFVTSQGHFKLSSSWDDDLSWAIHSAMVDVMMGNKAARQMMRQK